MIRNYFSIVTRLQTTGKTASAAPYCQVGGGDPCFENIVSTVLELG